MNDATVVATLVHSWWVRKMDKRNIYEYIKVFCVTANIMFSPLSLKIAPCTHVTREQKPQQELLRAQPTQLLLLLQQDEAERRVPQDELPGCGQAHDAAAHHGHVIGAARGEGETGDRQFR